MPTHLITLDEAIVMTTIFRAESEKILDPKFKGLGLLPVCETFQKKVFEDLLADPDCTGIRIYSAMDTELQMRFIVVGIDADNKDKYIQPNVDLPNDLYVIEKGVRCPTICPPGSVLNS